MISKEEIYTEIELILDKTFLISVIITFYKQLKEKKFEESDKYILSENFFNYTSISYDYLLCCELPKIFNCNFKRKEERGSIYNVLHLCEKYIKQLKENCEESESLESFINNVKERIALINVNVLKEYRDKYFAHSDKKYFYSKLSLIDNYKFDLDEFNELNKTAIDILTDIYSKISGTRYIFCPNMFNFDLNKIFESMK